MRAAFLSLDVVRLTEEFEERASVMKSVPRFLKGPYRIAMRVALEEISEGGCREDPVHAFAADVVAQSTTWWFDPAIQTPPPFRFVQQT